LWDKPKGYRVPEHDTDYSAYLPSEQEIERACVLIRADWSDDELEKRCSWQDYRADIPETGLSLGKVRHGFQVADDELTGADFWGLCVCNPE
jgi:hypothetical protein